MSRVKGLHTAPEMVVRRFLHAHGLRYSLHSKKLPGRPDIVLKKWSAVVLVHGCYWHRHKDCPKASEPRSNVVFWRDKFARHVVRDSENINALKLLGWRVFVVWGCELSIPRLTSLVRDIKETSGK